MTCGTCGTHLPPPAGSATAVGSHAAPCPHNCITGVYIQDGERLTHDAVTQYANLNRNPDYVDEVIGNVDRLSNRVNVFVTSQLARGAMNFRLSAVPHTDNAGYTPEEIAANPNYDCPETNVTGASPTLQRNRYGAESDVGIAVSGGEQFRIRAECTASNCGHVVESGPITIKRRVWLVPFAMVKEDGTRVTIPNLSSFKEYFDNTLHIVFRELPRQTMPRIVYRNHSAEVQIRDNLHEGYRASGAPDKEPYVMVIVFADSIADKVEFPHRITSRTLHRNSSHHANHEIVLPRYIWWDMGGPGGEWFVRGRFYSSLGNVDITRDMLTPLPGNTIPSRRNRIRLSVAPIFTSLDAQQGHSIGDQVTGRVEIRVNIPDHWCNGYTYSGGNFILMATRTFWENVPARMLINIMTHEFGHTMAMVPHTNRSDNRGLDRVPTSYTGRGHQGQHCSQNVPAIAAGAEYNSTHHGHARCNMYGAGGPDYYENTMRYCPQCTRSAKQMDLSPGWSGTYTPERTFF